MYPLLPCLTAMPFFFKALIFKNRHALNDVNFKAKFGTLVDGLKKEDNHPLGIYWNMIKLDRFLIVSFVLFFMSDQPFI